MWAQAAQVHVPISSLCSQFHGDNMQWSGHDGCCAHSGSASHLRNPKFKEHAFPEGLLTNLCWEGEMILFILVRKQSYSLSWKEIIFLPQVIYYANILGKIVQEKCPQLFCWEGQLYWSAMEICLQQCLCTEVLTPEPEQESPCSVPHWQQISFPTCLPGFNAFS